MLSFIENIGLILQRYGAVFAQGLWNTLWLSFVSVFLGTFLGILVALGNEVIVMIKQTSLASVFFFGELMTAYKQVQSTTFLALEPLTISGLIYLFLTVTLSRITRHFEKRMKQNER